MHDIFQTWLKELVPVQITANEKGKKDARPKPWKDGQVYTSFKSNTIALRTGSKSVNVIDVDTKDLELISEPLKTWLEDRLLFEDTLIVESKNGYHFYFDKDAFNLRTTTKTGANASQLDYVDFRGEGGLIFIHSTSDIASYEVISDATPTSDIEDIVNLLPLYREVVETQEPETVGFENLDDEEDTEISEVSSSGKQTLEEVMRKVNMLSADCSRDEWLRIMASAYNLIDKNPNELKERLQKWSQTAENYDLAGFKHAWKEISTGKFGTKFKGGSLIMMSDKVIEEKLPELQEEKFNLYVKKISEATSMDEIKNLFGKDWKSVPICSHEQQKALPSICAEKVRAIYKANGDKTKVSVSEFKPLILVKETKKKITIDGVTPYYSDNKFHITTDDGIIIEEIYKGSLPTVGASLGLTSSDFTEYVSFNATLVKQVLKETDYLTEDEVEFAVSKSDNPSELPSLRVLTNPLHGVVKKPSRQDIVDDFFENIWNGKAEDIIRLVGLSMRFKETKLNKIHIVAPSNAGKTAFLENVGFQTIHMKRLIQALNADKGIGKNVIDGLKGSGFLLIDEANDALTQEIKNIDNRIQLDQFGQGGTQDIKLHFTCLTSTHKTAVRGMSDEMYNRLMIVQLRRDEMKYELLKSSLFLNEKGTYTKTITQHAKWLLKDSLTNPDYDESTLRTLQDKYRLELNDDVSEMLTEISERIVEEYKSLAGDSGDVIVRDGEYFIKRKKDLLQSVEDRFNEYSHIDKGKYADELGTHFVGDNRVSIRIDGKTEKFYPLKLKKYYLDMESDESLQQQVVDMFDDLDEY